MDLRTVRREKIWPSLSGGFEERKQTPPSCSMVHFVQLSLVFVFWYVNPFHNEMPGTGIIYRNNGGNGRKIRANLPVGIISGKFKLSCASLGDIVNGKGHRLGMEEYAA
ncbi:hypothetical protein FACS1894196_2700 [Clostridia bacterium]|nr:hypothetical protein FACS1894196_2700 [Clostridia bacterium]